MLKLTVSLMFSLYNPYNETVLDCYLLKKKITHDNSIKITCFRHSIYKNQQSNSRWRELLEHLIILLSRRLPSACGVCFSCVYFFKFSVTFQFGNRCVPFIMNKRLFLFFKFIISKCRWRYFWKCKNAK